MVVEMGVIVSVGQVNLGFHPCRTIMSHPHPHTALMQTVVESVNTRLYCGGVRLPSPSLSPLRSPIRYWSKSCTGAGCAFPAKGPPSPVVGIALDGFPIYALYDRHGVLQVRV